MAIAVNLSANNNEIEVQDMRNNTLTDNAKRAMAKAAMDEILRMIESSESKTISQEEIVAHMEQFIADPPVEKVEQAAKDDNAGLEIKNRFWSFGNISCKNEELLLRDIMASDKEGYLQLQQEYSSLRSLLRDEHLLEIEAQKTEEGTKDSIDAFGVPFQAIEEPMPSVKLAGGFDATIRTMFKEQRCQSRYGRIENASYPISPSMRMQFQSALEWAGSAAQKNITWINTDQNEILLAYPLSLPDIPISYTAMFKRSENKAIAFSAKAKHFIQELQQTKTAEMDSKSRQIRIFVLRKIDKARTKVIYTRQTDAFELEKCSEAWTCGCANLPTFSFGTPQTPYPMDAADILNRFWKQSGEIATDKFKPCPKYHGMELLMEPDLSVTSDLHRLAESAINIGPFLGNICAKHEWRHPIWEKTKDTLAMLGLFLNREHIRKDRYMENLPYLYGQLLKAADELHALYCTVVRDGDIPPQLVGSSLFQSAAEAPTRTMQVLSRRLMPYYSWAKSYRLKNVNTPGKESWRAGWLYSTCEKTASKLQDNWTAQTQLSDAEKAQLFIGYLAAFPRKEQVEQNTEEEV